MIDGIPRPDHGDGWQERHCQHCHASWIGHRTDGNDWCPWCERRLELEAEMRRRELLNPPWLHSDAGTPRYDALTATEKAVWDRTRGHARDADSLIGWVVELRRAVDNGHITRGEAEQAMRKAAGT